MEVTRLLHELAHRTLHGVYEESLTLGLEPPASEARIRELEACLGRPLPAGFRDYLRLADGMLFFGEEILGVDCADARWTSRGLLPFHAWGNGDVDCLVISGEGAGEGEAPVVFCRQGPDLRIRVAGSFGEWLRGAFAEIERCGVLRHPVDYGRRCGSSGLYAEVAAELRRRGLIDAMRRGNGNGSPRGGTHGIGGESVVPPHGLRR